MRFEDLFEGRWKTAQLFVQAVQEAGGRKVASKDFPDSDLRLVEDLGLRPSTFTFDCVLATTHDSEGNEETSYTTMRDELLRAIDDPEPGDLVHPWRGTLPNMKMLDYSFGETLVAIGRLNVTLTFTVTNTDGRPIPREATRGDVSTGVEAIDTQAVADMAAATITERFTRNFTTMNEKIDEVAEKFRVAMTAANVNELRIDAFADRLAQFSADTTLLVSTPQATADGIQGLYASARGLYQTQRGTFEAMREFFDFGDGDTEIETTTSGLAERQENQFAMNSAMQSMALASAYEAAATIEYATIDELDEDVAILEAQYQKLADSDMISADLLETLSDLRERARKYFDAQRLTAPRIVTVRTFVTSIDLLAYRYYGSSEEADVIGDLNEIVDPAFVEGDVEVLTA